MTGGLLDWLAAPRVTAGLRFLDDDGTWESITYEELARLIHATARELRDHGLATGQVVVVLHRTGVAFAASFFGVLVAGGTPAPLAPPVAFGGPRRWSRHAAQVIEESGAVMLLADRDLTEVASTATPPRCPVLPPATALDTPPARWDPAETALVQFTSGSRGRARGVRVSRANLESNIAMIERRWSGRTGGTGVSWLPLYHDLGLILGLLTPVIRRSPAGLMRPEQFVREPLTWLRQYSGETGGVMLVPGFGLEYIVRRIRPEQLGGLDLSGVEAVVTGSERVRMDAAGAFLELLRPCGLRPSALKPAYGLAEATLGVTCAPLGSVPRAVAVAPGAHRPGEPLQVLGSAPVSRRPSTPGTWHVSCGTPLDGLTVRIVDDHGCPLHEGHLGEITVRGPSVALGHTREDEDRATRFEDGVLVTGDAGFMVDGELFVVGRIGDSLQVRGRNVYVEDLEAALAGEGLFTRHRTVVLAGYVEAEPAVRVLTTAPSAEHAVDCLAPLVGSDVAVHVVKVKAADIELTSSGKPRRRRMWRRILAGDLDGRTLAASTPARART